MSARSKKYGQITWQSLLSVMLCLALANFTATGAWAACAPNGEGTAGSGDIAAKVGGQNDGNANGGGAGEGEDGAAGNGATGDGAGNISEEHGDGASASDAAPDAPGEGSRESAKGQEGADAASEDGDQTGEGLAIQQEPIVSIQGEDPEILGQRAVRSSADNPTMDIEATIKADGKDDRTLSADDTFSVDFSKQFTLHVVVKSTLNLPDKKVEITVPDGLTVVEYPIPTQGGMAQSVVPESIDKLNSANAYGDYRPKSGTITYSLKNTAEENSFNIILEPDTVLWNRKSGQHLANPLKIRTYTGDIGDGDAQHTYETVSAEVVIGDSPTNVLTTGPRLRGIGVKTGVPAAADQPFVLRQVWLSPDKDRIEMAQYFKELEITIALPHYTKGSTTVYATLDHIAYDLVGSHPVNRLAPKGSGDANLAITENADHTVTLKWNQLYLDDGEYFTPYFKWEAGKAPATTDTVRWENESIKATTGTDAVPTGNAVPVGGKITWQDGSEWYLSNDHFKNSTINYKPYDGESMTVQGRKVGKGIYSSNDPSAAYYLGQFHVVNHGSVESVEKTVEFEYNNSAEIGVTAQRIPATTGNTVKVWYTTNVNATERYAGAFTSSGNFVAFTAQKASLGAGEYFTKIRAEVGEYDKDYISYVASRSEDPTSGYAATFGKLLAVGAGTYKSFATMKMYDTDGGESAAIEATYDVTVSSSAGEIPLGMEQAYDDTVLGRLPILSKTSATAGDMITFNGLISSSAYPYSNINIITDPEIYLRLPSSITVKNLRLYRQTGRMADKIFLFETVQETEAPATTDIAQDEYTITPTAPSATSSYTQYKITFAHSEKVGWFTDDLGQNQIGISFDMEIAKSAEAMTLDMRECVRVKSASRRSLNDTGTLNQYQVADTYDMNGNSDTTELFSTFNVNARGTKLSVVAARLGLTFTFGARMVDLNNTNPDYRPDDYSNYEVKGEKVLLRDKDHAVDMLFTLANETGRDFNEAEAKAFYYFIPVPKNGDLWDTHMQDKAFDFNMKLAGQPTVAGISSDNVLVKYSTTVDSKAPSGHPLHYSNTDNYVEANEITDWSQVKMIRIAARESVTSIRKEAALQVCMHLVPEFDDNAHLVGSAVNFGPCGVSPYSVGNTTNQGHNPLPRIQVEFQTGIIEGKVFLDKNFNGTYEADVDELYTGDVNVYAPHWNSVTDTENTPVGDTDTHRTVAKDGSYQLTGRMADLYHVIVTNPGNPDRASSNPMRFSLPAVGSKFSIGDDPATATANAELQKNAGVVTLDIGLQEPHAVTFKVPASASLSSDIVAAAAAIKASLGEDSAALLTANAEKSVNVWHGDTLGGDVPVVTAGNGYRFTGTWSDGARAYTTEQLENAAITEDKVFTAEVKPLYSVVYNGNGNTEGTVPSTVQHVEGDSVLPDYRGTDQLKKGGAIFVGWSETQISEVLQADAKQDDIDKIISQDAHTMPSRNVTLYAVYAVDGNGNGNPDYNDSSVHVRYHGNNGDYTDVICPHHHVAGGTAELSKTGEVFGKLVTHGEPADNAESAIKSHTFTYTDVDTGKANIFAGWSTKPILNTVIRTKAEYDGLKGSIVTAVPMLEKAPGGTSDVDAADTGRYADLDGNTNVYAVWVADRNGNGTGDYLEERRITYRGNARDGGVVANVPADANIYIPQDKTTLSSQVPTHSAVNGTNVAFVCWTSSPVEGILQRSGNVPESKITEVIFGNEDKSVYAAWGYDENNNGTADVLETYTLTYDLNGGNGATPAPVSGIEKRSIVSLTTDTNFARSDDELFVGWSTVEHAGALAAGERERAESILIKNGTVIFGSDDIKLYAVWAKDANGNGVADYTEARHIAYDGNPCEGMVNSGTVPADATIYLPGDKHVLAANAPVHTEVDGKAVMFVGWTAEAAGSILSRSDAEPAALTEIIFADKDVTVHAAWGYDENADGVPDVLETYALSYDLNGGSGVVPAEKTGIKKGSTVPLARDGGFTRAANELFVGWSRAKHETAFTAAQKDVAECALVKGGSIDVGPEDVTLYAVWAQDANGNGMPDYAEGADDPNAPANPIVPYDPAGSNGPSNLAKRGGPDGPGPSPWSTALKTRALAKTGDGGALVPYATLAGAAAFVAMGALMAVRRRRR